jgi:hypothetical protein
MQPVQRLDQLVNRGLAQFRIRRVRHLSPRNYFDVQRTLAGQRQLVFGGLAIDHKARADRMLVRRLRANRVALFAHQKQQANENARPAQLLRRRNLGRDNSLGVADPRP